jgi:hypothetical protein
MPPALVPLGLIAIGVPSALRAAVGRPRLVLPAIAASVLAVLVAQVFGELSGTRIVLLGDAHVGLAIVASAVVSVIVALLEGAPPSARARR